MAEHVLKKPVHQLDDIQLHLKFASEIPEVGDDTSKLIVKNIPEGIHEQHLELFFRLSIKTVTQVDFSFKQVVNNSTVLQLSRQLSHEGEISMHQLFIILYNPRFICYVHVHA